MQGPKIPWKAGRIDGFAQNATPDGRLPDATQGADHLRNVRWSLFKSDNDLISFYSILFKCRSSIAWGMGNFRGRYAVHGADSIYLLQIQWPGNCCFIRCSCSRSLPYWPVSGFTEAISYIDLHLGISALVSTDLGLSRLLLSLTTTSLSSSTRSKSPYIWSFSLFPKLIVSFRWVWKKWSGPKQYEDKKTKTLMMLPWVFTVSFIFTEHWLRLSSAPTTWLFKTRASRSSPRLTLMTRISSSRSTWINLLQTSLYNRFLLFPAFLLFSPNSWSSVSPNLNGCLLSPGPWRLSMSKSLHKWFQTSSRITLNALKQICLNFYTIFHHGGPMSWELSRNNGKGVVDREHVCGDWSKEMIFFVFSFHYFFQSLLIYLRIYFSLLRRKLELEPRITCN